MVEVYRLRVDGVGRWGSSTPVSLAAHALSGGGSNAVGLSHKTTKGPHPCQVKTGILGWSSIQAELCQPST